MSFRRELDLTRQTASRTIALVYPKNLSYDSPNAGKDDLLTQHILYLDLITRSLQHFIKHHDHRVIIDVESLHQRISSSPRRIVTIQQYYRTNLMPKKQRC